MNIVDIVRYYLVDEGIPALAELGEVWIGQFYQELETVHDFTDQDWELIQSIQDMKPRPRGLDLENIPVGRFLGRGVDILRTRSEKRKVLMLVTATADRESLKNLDEYRDMLRITDIDLYVVSFGPRAISPGSSSPARFNPYYFKKLVSETGGKFYLSGDYVFPSEFNERSDHYPLQQLHDQFLRTSGLAAFDPFRSARSGSREDQSSAPQDLGVLSSTFHVPRSTFHVSRFTFHVSRLGLTIVTENSALQVGQTWPSDRNVDPGGTGLRRSLWRMLQ